MAATSANAVAPAAAKGKKHGFDDITRLTLTRLKNSNSAQQGGYWDTVCAGMVNTD
ncbi:protein of unknown function [Hyphomicrobium sp. MC1]|nr:protein of unknown function [Hyphomicrobium sp. MC1]